MLTQWDAGGGNGDTGGRHEDNQRGEKHKCKKKPRPDRKETKPRKGSQKKFVRNRARDAKKTTTWCWLSCDAGLLHSLLGIVPLSQETKINTRQVLLCGVFGSVRDRFTPWYNKSLTACVSPLKPWRWSIFLCCAGSRAVNCEVQLSLNAPRLGESDFTEKARQNNFDNLEPHSLINTSIFIKYVPVQSSCFSRCCSSLPSSLLPPLPYLLNMYNTLLWT